MRPKRRVVRKVHTLQSIKTKYTLQRIWKEILKTFLAGQKEYGHSPKITFRNFVSIGTELGLAPEWVLWVYFHKHCDGILAYLKGHKSQREDVRGRIKDAIVYLLLLWMMVDQTNGPKRN